jgi:hypothetical protein
MYGKTVFIAMKHHGRGKSRGTGRRQRASVEPLMYLHLGTFLSVKLRANTVVFIILL